MTQIPSDNHLLNGLNPADLLKQALPAATAAGECPHLFLAPALSELAPFFPDLELIELIGEGGMGAVYKARQIDLDRLVALKILPEEISGDDAFSSQFTREARALAKLNHIHIVSIHEFGKKQNLYYIVMEYVDGTSLRKIMEKGLVNPKEALAIIPQICDALQYAHDKGIIHRDIKPENILLNRDGVVKVADFGLVKLLPESASSPSPGGSASSPAYETILSRDGKVMGTPAYMPPEQRSHPLQVDHRADIYSLGVVFYQMLTGELPGTPFVSPSCKTSVNVQLDEVVQKALEENPDHRYQQVSAMKTAVETLSSLPPRKSFFWGKRGWLIFRLLFVFFCGSAATFLLVAFSRSSILQVIFCVLMAIALVLFAIVLLNKKALFQTMKEDIPKRYIVVFLLAASALVTTVGVLAIGKKISVQKVPDKTESWERTGDMTVPPTVNRVSSWLSLVDRKNNEESYKQVCSGTPGMEEWERKHNPLVSFAGKMNSKEDWGKLVSHVRDISGGTLSRTWKETKDVTLPELPFYDEVKIFTFETSFEHKKNVLETVIMARVNTDPNNGFSDKFWAVVGYYLSEAPLKQEEPPAAEK